MRRSCVVWASLGKWHHALTQVPDKSKVLAESVGQLFRAWQGDKLLGAAAAAAVATNTEIRDPGTATVLVAKALSNQFFTQHAPTLFPTDFFGFLSRSNPKFSARSGYYSDRQWGSTLEAAVFEVHQSCDRSEEAVAELAEWLIENAQGDSQQIIDVVNLKGRLLSLGGTIESYRVGGPDHSPIHEAIAEWGSVQGVERQLGSKQQVEELAARKVLIKVQGQDLYPPPQQEKVLVEDCRRPDGLVVGNSWRQKIY